MSSPSPKETSSSSLKSKIDAVATTKKSHPLFTIANEIYTAFFATTTPKTKTKKFLTEHLTEKLTEIEKAIPVANKADFQGRIEKVRTDLQTATSTAAAAAAAVATAAPAVSTAADAATTSAATSAAPTVTSSSPTSGGGNLNVMTFNTWHEALGDSPKQTFCMDGGSTNKCQNYIRQAILDHMKNHEQSIVFLQEFTYKFDEFFNVSGAGVTVNKDGIASKTMAKDKDSSSSSSSIPAFRYFTMTYNSKTFHVYIGQIGFSVIATIYSDTFHAGPADAFFVGNLAAGNLKDGSVDSNADSYDLAYTFSGTSDKSSVTETKSSYSAFGGNRPFIVLRFDTKKCVLVNVHVPHGNDVFRDGSKGKPTGTLAEFAFNALARFIPDTVFKDKPQNEYAFILGGDFNTATPDIKKWLTESTTLAVTRTTGTCCTTDGGLNFTKPGAVDHIFSTLPITKYDVHDISKTEKTTTNPRYFFSDHLPVYAEIDFKAPAATATSSP